MNTSRPKPQTTYEKHNDCRDDFCQLVAKFVFYGSNITFSYLQYRQRQTVVTLTLYNSGWDRLSVTFLSLRHPCFGLDLVAYLATTRLDKLTNCCVKLGRQVFLNFSSCFFCPRCFFIVAVCMKCFDNLTLQKLIMWFPFQNQNLEAQDVKWNSFDGRQASASNVCATEQLLFSSENDIQVKYCTILPFLPYRIL